MIEIIWQGRRETPDNIRNSPAGKVLDYYAYRMARVRRAGTKTTMVVAGEPASSPCEGKRGRVTPR